LGSWRQNSHRFSGLEVERAPIPKRVGAFLYPGVVVHLIPIMPESEFFKLSEEEQNAHWDAELDSMTPEEVD
jgi:hypothetical protein